MDEEGERVRFPALCYPKYSYFFNHLQRFLPRFTHTVEEGNLVQYVANGDRMVKTIKDEACHFTETVTVYAFGLPNSKTSVQSLVVHKVEESDVEISKTTIEQFKAESHTRPHLACIIATFFCPSDEDVQRLIQLLRPTSEYQLDNILILNKYDKTLHLLTDIISGKPSRYSDVSAGPRVIESMLEKKISEWYDQVTAFIHKISPKYPSGSSEDLGTYLCMQLLPYIKEISVVKEILPPAILNKDNESPDENELPGLIQKIGANLQNYCTNMCESILRDELARRCGLTTSVMHTLLSEYQLKDKIAKQTKSVQIDAWVKKCRYNETVAAVPNFTNACVAELKKNTLEELCDWVAEKMKIFEVVHKLEFELHGMLRMTKHSTTKIPVLPKLTYELQSELLKIDGVESSCHRYGTLQIHVSKGALEANIEKDVEKALKKHQYKHRYYIRPSLQMQYQVRPQSQAISHGDELYAWKVEDRKKEDKDDTEKMWHLASIGCFVKIAPSDVDNKPSQPKKQKIGSSATGGTKETPIPASSIVVKQQAGEEPSDAVDTQSGIDVSTENKGKSEKPVNNSLFAITCAHAILGCENDIYSPTKHTNDHFGHVVNEFTMYEPHFLDLACIEILDTKEMKCERSATRDDGLRKEKRWRVLDRKHASGMQVYMIGAVSRLKHGHIVSSDLITKDIDRLNKILKQNADSKGESFDPLYTMLIEPNACLPRKQSTRSSQTDDPQGASGGTADPANVKHSDAENENVFSQKGDSGSVIWCVDEGRVCAVALLCGDVKERTRGQLKCSSYGSSMNQLFQVFENRFNCTVKPARSESQSSSTESEGEEIWV